MPPKVFPPHQNKEAIKQLLREGVSVQECTTRFSSPTERTIWSYYKEVQDEKEGKAPAGKKAGAAITPAVTVPGVAKEAFTAVGAQTTPPPEPPTREWMYIGPMRMPVEDWGYSSTRNLLIVSDTFDIVKQKYELPKTVKVGDFLAALCQSLRMSQGWDVIGAGVYLAKIVKEKEE